MRRRHAALALIGAMLLVLTMSVPQVSAQTGGSKQIVSGQTVTWNGEWTPMPDVSVADANVELLALSRDTSIVGYGGTSFPVSGNEVRDMLLEGFATDQQETRQVDRGEYDNVSYSIDLSTSEGVTLSTFTLVIENPANTTMALLISSPEEFEATMTAAQAGITIDGAPIFDGVDAAQMQSTILAARGPVSEPAATPEATGQDGGLGDLGDAIGGTPTPAGEQNGASLPSAVTVASSGVEVRHSSDWSVQRQDDTSVSLGTVASPAVLVTVLDLGPVTGGVDASVLAAGLSEQVDSLADAEVVAALSPSPDRVVIVFRDPDDSGELYRIYDIAVDASATTAVTLIVGVSDLDAAVALVTSTIQVEGEPVMTDLRSLVPEIFAGA
jgi:hypothetical protein